MEQIQLARWEDFSEAVNRIKSSDPGFGHPQHPHYLYRGVGRQTFFPQSSLERSSLCSDGTLSVFEYLLRIEECRPQIESLTGREWPKVHERIAKTFYDREKWYGCYSYMTYLRHHGYPSPLLDWSASPYVAAYFAFDHERTSPNDTEPVAIFVIEDPMSWQYNLAEPNLRVLGPRVRTHARHYQQQSLYTVCTARRGNGWDYLPYTSVFEAGHTNSRYIKRISIPYEERQKALMDLNRSNINAYSLFGSEESLLRTIYIEQAVRKFIIGSRG